jgi:L-threonylcarbamoyladenylate synthase
MHFLDNEEAAAAIARGQVVAAATETFFGLLALADDPLAIDALLAVKARTASKGISLLLPHRAEWSRWVRDIPPLAAALADHFWPGPLTIALGARADVDARLVLDGSIAARLPSECPAAEITRRLGRAVTATSANPPGAAPATTPSEAVAALREFVRDSRLFVADGVAPGGLASTVLAVVDERAYLFRAGAVSTPAIERVIGRPVSGSAALPGR